MPQATTGPADQHPGHPTPVADPLATGIAHTLQQPGLAVVTGVAGIGRTTVLQRLASAFRGPVHHGGGLSMLRARPGLALSRAVRAGLPVHDVALCAEAVRSRVRGGLLIIDDLQWCDPVTLAVLPHLAAHCRIAAALRTPHRLPDAAVAALREAGTFLPVPPLSTTAATELVTRLAPGLAEPAAAQLARRGGGNPLVLSSLARTAQHHPQRLHAPARDDDTAVHAVAESIADLPRAERTALAALGLLGRPASTATLGAGVQGLAEAGMVRLDGDVAAAASPFVAEVAAGLLDADARVALHRRLAALVDDLEAARHLAAAGDHDAARDRAKAAATVDNKALRAEALLFAVSLPGSHGEDDRVAAAAAALSVGRPRSALTVLAEASSVRAAVLRVDAQLHAGQPERARLAAADLPDAAAAPEAAYDIDRVRLLCAPPGGAVRELAAQIRVRHGERPPHPGLAAALAAADAAARAPGWKAALAAAAAAAGRDGDAVSARWSAWLLVECLIADGELAAAQQACAAAAQACTVDHAFSWQTRFVAAQLWCQVLQGRELDAATGRAVSLLDHALPSVARGYASAAASLAEADAGALRNARYRLRRAGTIPESVAQLLRWVTGEAAWLDNQPQQAAVTAEGSAPGLVAGLRYITGHWAAHDGAAAPPDPAADGLPEPARRTLAAWHAATGFDAAADAWRDLVVREQVRCLLAAGVHAVEAAAAVPPLEEAERLADEAGLTVLAGRARQALRRHRVRRDQRGARAGDELTARERQVLAMVADGDPTRRIAGALGITRETVETHIRAGMRKLGAKTRTEAAVRAATMQERGP